MSGSIALPPGLSRQRALRGLSAAFARAGIASADEDARILVLAAAELSWVQLIADPDLPLGEAAQARLAALAQRRLAHEPVSRILGQREFWGLTFAITSAVLDPRPDSETVVEAGLRAMAGRRQEPLRLLDLGTGSGALLCALLTVFPNTCGLGVDVSPVAAQVAAANLRNLGLSERGMVIVGNWTGAAAAGFDLIVSNPPYITSADIARLDDDVRLHDPHLALDGGADGFDAYHALARCAGQALAANGAICVEAGAGQAAGICEIFAAQGFVTVAVDEDLSGHARCVTLRRRQGGKQD